MKWTKLKTGRGRVNLLLLYVRYLFVKLDDCDLLKWLCKWIEVLPDHNNKSDDATATQNESVNIIKCLNTRNYYSELINTLVYKFLLLKHSYILINHINFFFIGVIHLSNGKIVFSDYISVASHWNNISLERRLTYVSNDIQFVSIRTKAEVWLIKIQFHAIFFMIFSYFLHSNIFASTKFTDLFIYKHFQV